MIVSVAYTYYAWRRINMRGAASFGALMLLVAFWALGTGMMVSSPSDEGALLWYKLRYISITTVPTMFLVFTLQYVKQGFKLSAPRAFLLFLVPLITLGIIRAAPDFFVRQVVFHNVAPLHLFAYDVTGPWFTVHLVYSLAMIIAAVILLVRKTAEVSQIYRGRYIPILVGLIPPMLVSLVLSVFVDPSFVMFSPIAFLVTGMATGLSLFRYRMFEILPIAQKTLINSMSDGVVVLDHEHTILQVNPAAEKFLGISESKAVGKSSRDSFQHLPSVLEHFWCVHEENVNFEINTAGGMYYFDVTVTPIRDGGGVLGKLVIFRNVTEMIKSMKLMEKQFQEIQSLQAELKEQAVRDALTGLYNRRYMMEFFEKELARARRDQLSLSVVIIDVDQFKRMNDTIGHSGGDRVLQELANLLTARTRKMDVACRFGGEEFVILMRNAEKKWAVDRAEDWRSSFAEMRINFQETIIQATISIGVAAFPADGDHADDLIQAADTALYQAKNGGRNRVVAYAASNETGAGL